MSYTRTAFNKDLIAERRAEALKALEEAQALIYECIGRTVDSDTDDGQFRAALVSLNEAVEILLPPAPDEQDD